MKASLPRSPNACHIRRWRKSDGARQNSEEHSDYNSSKDRQRIRNRRESLKVAIVGFGMMGRQIAQVFAQKGYHVTATDEYKESLPAGLQEIEKGPYGLTAAISKGKLTQDEAAKA